MNAGRDLSGPESHSVPVLLSPDGYGLYVKVTQPFHFSHLHPAKAKFTFSKGAQEPQNDGGHLLCLFHGATGSERREG